MTDLFVANFPYDTAQSELETIFSRFGEVESVKIIVDRDTGCSRGFGFVKMEDSAAEAAVASLNRAIFGGRPLRVRVARPIQRRGNPGDPMGYQDHRDGYQRPSYNSQEKSYNYRY